MFEGTAKDGFGNIGLRIDGAVLPFDLTADKDAEDADINSILSAHCDVNRAPRFFLACAGGNLLGTCATFDGTDPKEAWSGISKNK